MDLKSSRPSTAQSELSTTYQPNMSASVMMPSPAHHASLNEDRPWQAPRAFQVTELKRHTEKLELPSFRDTFGDLLSAGSSPSAETRKGSATITSPHEHTRGSPATPEYIAGSISSKRRRIEADDSQDWRPSQVPRYYRSPERQTGPNVSPPPAHVSSTTRTQTWPVSIHASAPQGNATPLLTPEAKHAEGYHSTSAPLSAGLASDRHSGAASAGREQAGTEYRKVQHEHGGYFHSERPGPEGRPPYQGPSYSNHQPERYERLPTNHEQFYERTAYAAPAYGPQYPFGLARYVDTGYIGLNGNHKPRKRRGNLPKETTDKLRAWFVAHLSHPYPTEDEKQELMHETKLQMNQISNWFINARRRQLPVMTSNAQTEQDLMDGRRDARSLPSKVERVDYNQEDQTALSFSDDERRGSAATEEMHGWKEHVRASVQRESV